MRSKDRLAELRQLAGVPDPPPAASETGDPPCAPHKEIEDIYQEVMRIRGWLHELQHETQLMRRLHADPTFHTNKQLQEQLEAAATRWGGAALKASGALRQFEARLSRCNHAAARITRLQYAAARRAYVDALAHHHALLDAARDAQLQLLRRQLRLADLTVSDEECESLLDSGNVSLFVDNVRAETAEARRQLRDVEARRDELARVEAALQDVRALFAQLAHLVAAQQDQVDSVEYYALQASEHVGSGGQQLLKGTVSRRRGRQKKVSLIVCLLVGFGVVLLVLVLT